MKKHRKGGNKAGNLVVTRKAHESILIGNDIEIFVNAIRGNKVSLCVKAPLSIAVVRKELVYKLITDTERPTDARP